VPSKGRGELAFEAFRSRRSYVTPMRAGVMFEEYPNVRCFQRYTYVCETITFGAFIP